MSLGNLFVRRTRTIGDLRLDAVIEEDYDLSVEVTSNPVEFGSEMNDHAIIKPLVYIMKGVVTNTPIGIAALGQIKDSVSGFIGDSTGTGATRAQIAFEELEKIRVARELITVQTGLKLYENLILTNLKINQNKSTSKALFFSATLVEIFVPKSERVQFPEEQLEGNDRLQGSSPSQKGRQQTALPASDAQRTSIAQKLLNNYGG